MSRYFFHVMNGDGRTPDEEGAELASPDQARERAIDGIRSILAEEAQTGRLDLTGRIEVADEKGLVLFVVPYSDAISVKGAGG